MQKDRKETPIQVAIKAMRDFDGTNGKKLTLDQIANKYYGDDKIASAYALMTAKRYVDSFGKKQKLTLDIQE